MATKSVISGALCCLTLSVVAECVSSFGQDCPGNCSCPANTVHCDGHNSTALPVGLPTNSSDLTLINYNLPELDLTELHNLSQLVGLKLSRNNIRHIKGTLEVFRHLTSVELEGNYLTNISPKLFGSIAEQLKDVNLGDNPFNCDCGGILLNTDICDCTNNMFDCTCNIKWLQEQVKLNPNVWVGVKCHNSSKDTDIRDVDISDFWCRHKLCWIIGIGCGIVIVIVSTIVILRQWCKARRGYVPINSPDEDGTTESETQADVDTDDRVSSSTLPGAASPQTEPEYSIQQATREPMAAPDATGLDPPSCSLPSQPLSTRETQRPSQKETDQENAIANMGHVVTEKQLDTLAKKLGAEWESLAIHLGLTKNDVFQCKEDNRIVERKIFDMLTRWKSKEGSNATVEKLLEILKAFDPPLDKEKYEFLEKYLW